MQSECRTDEYGNKVWLLNDRYHKEDGPAIEWNDGSKSWFLNGLRHRLDGPACEYPDGRRYWFINGECITFKQWLEQVWDTLSIEEQERYIFNGFEDAE